jgi:hypothetical protein
LNFLTFGILWQPMSVSTRVARSGTYRTKDGGRVRSK